MSWILSADEWASLRDAWQKRQRTEEVGDDATRAREAEERPAATEALPECTKAEPLQVEAQAAKGGSAAAQRDAELAKELFVAATEPVKQLNETQRVHELTQTALSDWGAFRELFRACPDSADIGAWEALADSPVALLRQAEKLIWMQEVRVERQKHQLEREFEDEVTRAQNSIAGYYIYCRKHFIVPSLEHLLDFIPVMRTEHSPGAVREAWRREAEYQK